MTNSNVTPLPVSTHPVSTQSQHPWRATFRTIFAVVVGLAASWGTLVQLLGLNTQWQWVTAGGVVAAAVTRALATPAVEDFLQVYFPWLAAQPLPKHLPTHKQ